MSTFFRIVESDNEGESEYVVATRAPYMEGDVDPERLAIPVKIYDHDLAHEVQRKMTYGHHDEEFVRGLVEGVRVMNNESVEYDPGSYDY